MAEVKGFNLLLKYFKDLPKEAERGIDVVLETYAGFIRDDASKAAPVSQGTAGSGNLQRSLNYRKSDELTYTIFDEAEYAAYVEFGTGPFAGPTVSKLEDQLPGVSTYAYLFKGATDGNMPAQPYLFPALLRNRENLFNDLENALKDAI